MLSQEEIRFCGMIFFRWQKRSDNGFAIFKNATLATVMRNLLTYFDKATPNSNFVPMNANFCLVNEFFGYVKKKDRKEMYAQRSLEFIDKLLGDING